jgi:hypothetical protein
MDIYEAGIRDEAGKYSMMIQSNDKDAVIDCIETMKNTIPLTHEISFLEKTYELVCTTPHIIGRK